MATGPQRFHPQDDMPVRPGSERDFSDWIWRPSREWIESTNIWHFMQSLGFVDREAFLAWSRDHNEEFWERLVRAMNVEWFEPYRQVVDLSAGPEWAKWFVGGQLNIAQGLPGPLGRERPDRNPVGRREQGRFAKLGSICYFAT